jgi:hypothetical protein
MFNHGYFADLLIEPFRLRFAILRESGASAATAVAGIA